MSRPISSLVSLRRSRPWISIRGANNLNSSAAFLSFANPVLHHRTSQVAMDGSQKLPARLLAPIRERVTRRQGDERVIL